MSKKSGPAPNDQRAVVKNPNNPAHGADQANRARQAQGSAPAQQPKQPASNFTLLGAGHRFQRSDSAELRPPCRPPRLRRH
jgi:hypothetical protein